MATVDELPPIIQGGMGMQISSWQLASAVARSGQLGVVSGTALDLALARHLQDGDLDGHYRRALAHFPDQAMVERVVTRYYVPGGRAATTPYRPVPRLVIHAQAPSVELSVLAAFTEVWLAKDGHDGPIGVNLLEKIQMAIPTVTFGAMLAGVDAVLVGAGVPGSCPACSTAWLPSRGGVRRRRPRRRRRHRGGRPRSRGAARRGASGLEARLPRHRVLPRAGDLPGARRGDPARRVRGRGISRRRAQRAASATGARRRGERPLRPARRAGRREDRGPGLPFWLAGAYGTPEGLARPGGRRPRHPGGTVFALAEESGLRDDLRRAVRASLGAYDVTVRTSALASPTGFPFKVVDLPGTITDPVEYAARSRQCDLGFLRAPYAKEDGSVGYRSGRVERTYAIKGGAVEDTDGRVCLCNGLTATAGMDSIGATATTSPRS